VSAFSGVSVTPWRAAIGLAGIQTIAPDIAVVPPKPSPFSNSATEAPSTAAVSAAVHPAAPDPSTTTS
jgi:hypothetical protein